MAFFHCREQFQIERQISTRYILPGVFECYGKGIFFTDPADSDIYLPTDQSNHLWR